MNDLSERLVLPIHLKRSGEYVVVAVRAPDGRWVDVIRERVDAPFSHIVEPSGIMKAMERDRP